MSNQRELAERIHRANISVHRIEVSYYSFFHPEVYIKQEQRRISKTLREADKLIANNCKRALDFGAGTGNLTEKLLGLGYSVTAVDISSEMCELLKRKFETFINSQELRVLNSPIEDLRFDSNEFDLTTCYSVLHHLPDYQATLMKLCGFLKKGGVMYLDHEASPYYWKSEPTILAELVKTLYFHTNPMLNSLYFQMMGFTIPRLEYTLSDYWHKKEHPIEHQRIGQVFKKEKFSSAKRTDYHLRGSWITNPVFPLYKQLCRPEMSYWIAQK